MNQNALNPNALNPNSLNQNALNQARTASEQTAALPLGKHLALDAFYYRLRWRAQGVHPGAHLTRTAGGSTDFRGFSPFLDQPNPRRIDLRASLLSRPYQLMVRSFNERSSIVVYAVVDTSASMRFNGSADKRALLAEISACIAWSATRSGDAFALIACDDRVACDDSLRQDLYAPPSFRPSAADEVRERLQTMPLKTHASASALPLAAAHLRHKRSLVFLISDFHLDEALLTQTLQTLAAHDVQPIVLWDSAEYANLPNWGWARVRDMETGAERALFLRPSLRRKIMSTYASHQSRLIALCQKNGSRIPFFVQDHFQAELLTRHLLEAN